MKTGLLILLLVAGYAQAQPQPVPADSLQDSYTSPRARPYEIAYVAAGINLKDEMSFGNTGGPSVEFLNGVLVRYKFNQLSLRLNGSFFEEQSREYAAICISCQYGSATAKNYRIGAGLQWTPFTKRELLYGFVDGNYKLRREDTWILEVNAGSARNYSVHAKVSGLDLVAGLGTKIRLYKNGYCSAEFAYNQYIAENKQRTIQTPTQDVSSRTSPYRFNTFLARLYFSMTF